MERWRFSFSYSAHGNYSSDQAQVVEDISAQGTAILERKTRNTFEGPPTTTVNYHYDGQRYVENCTLVVKIDGQGPQLPGGLTSLAILPDGFVVGLGDQSVTATRQYNDCVNPDLRSMEVEWPWATVVTGLYPYPASGTTLTGTFRTRVPIQIDLPTADGLAMTDVEVIFQLAPVDSDELRLELDDTGAFVDWRPTATADEKAGRPLEVTARLVTASGKTPTARVTRFTWKLTDTSREPGVAMNQPPNASDTRFDLRFQVAPGELGTLLDEEQTLERYTPPALSDTARIAPYDWGGWSKLEVTAVLDDGRMITGKAKSDQSDGLRIPKRASNSFIAEIWKKQTMASGADDSDAETRPRGDGTPGDGLSLYQEYRGFYVNGSHISGTVDTKELFVVALPEAMPGIALFELGTELKVHAELKESELGNGRVINGNKRDGPGSTVQHAVVMKKDVFERRTRGLIGEAAGGPGTPGSVRQIGISSSLFALDSDRQMKTVAHELSHAVNVYHHGRGDETVQWVAKGDGTVDEVGRTGRVAVRIRSETGALVSVTGSTTQGLGVLHGQSSGDDSCWMRYIYADTYVGQLDSALRYTLYDEPVGFDLCTSGSGTGINGMRQPQSRYGDAGPGLGNCTSQILVNDSAVAPRR
ncbi:MAG: hypothetical protein IT384_22660 [Deltaproteobacteria bacterium]|nr:hypothetical protein [Deltaproteobacteria bacterium]